ncbi:MAG: TetR/AcrR family transcriptional regulator [Lachnospiraceae bacterium]|nr:TetR/AcrR family transcriptional regulator [Lachnospiraceae bacterium]
MNPKFFDVKKEKQDAIINACLKIFAENGYKKSSTDVIVKEAGISKGLLFHYFESKKGAYQFIYDYSLKYMILELTQSVSKKERDFFEIQRTIEGVKTRVMKNYPYMQQFLDSIRFESHPDALLAIGEDRDVLRDTYNAIYRQADMTKFDDYIDVRRVIKMIGWMSEGFIKDKFRDPDPDLDEMNEEFSKYLLMLRDHLYKPSAKRTPMGLSQPSGTRSSYLTNNDTDSDLKTAASAASSDKKKADEEEEEPYVPGSLAGILLNARNTGESKPKDKKTDTVNKDNVMGYMKQEKSASSLLRELNKSPEQLSFEERLAIRDTSVFGVPAPKKKPKDEEAKEEEKDKAQDTKAADSTDKSDKSAEAAKTGTDASGSGSSTGSTDKTTDEKVQTGDAAKTSASGDKSSDQSADIHDKDTVIINAANAMNAAGAVDEDADITIAPGRDKSSDSGVTDEVADFLNKVSTGSVKIKKHDSENMVDHDGIKVKKITRSDLGEEDNTEGAGDREAQEIRNTFDDSYPQDDAYPQGDGYNGYGYGNGYGQGSMDPDMQDLSGQYYPQGEAAGGGYYPDQGQYGMGQGYDYYSGDLSYSPEDMAALAELYNNVNFDYGNDLNGNPGGYYEPQYDMNANTNEMPVNEVLAYRNAFTDQYMREEIAKNNAAGAQADGQDEYAEGAEDQNGKHKKKSFFGGLFGGKNKNDSGDGQGEG